MSKEIGWQHPIDESDQWDGFNDSGIEHFSGKPLLHLAREVIQNALDAGETGVVRVTMTLKKVETKSVPGIKELKDSIRCCASASTYESPKAEAFFKKALEELSQKKINILEISDYNTTGMVGPSENGTPFYAFMKAKGQSRKVSETAMGSFGIGKFAPYAVSNIRTIFVSTVYQDKEGTPQELTQGKTILMSHDKDGKRRQGVGFWGKRVKCQPIVGVSSDIPEWIQRANSKRGLKKANGTKLNILGFNLSPEWKELLAVSVTENFFGAINEGSLEVEINEDYKIEKDNIAQFFDQRDISSLISRLNLVDEPDHFDDCKNYLQALQNKTEVIIEESEMRELGLVQLRILINEGLPKKVCVLRNGMFISENLNRLKIFSDFKEFVAVVQCQSTKGNELLRAMEPPRHDNFEPDRLSTVAEQRKGKRALLDLANWVRDMLKRHAKEPVSDVTEIDELRDFFGDEGVEGAGRNSEEINPYGDIVIRARPLKIKTPAARVKGAGLDGIGNDEEEDDNGGGSGSGDGNGGEGRKRGGPGGRSESTLVTLDNVRAVVSGTRKRNLSFTPMTTSRIKLRVLESGADTDYEVAVVKSSKGSIENGYVTLNVKAGRRYNLDIQLDQKFNGAIKAVAYEV